MVSTPSFCQALQRRGARRVLVTLGSDGAVLVVDDNDPYWQPCLDPASAVVDETAAGDAFRSAFCVGLVEGATPADALQLGAAAGAIAVSRLGAIPSLPSRAECEHLISTQAARPDTTPAQSLAPSTADAVSRLMPDFASRLNSMKDRRELCDPEIPNDPLGWVERQGLVNDLTLVDFNYPQHLSAAGVSVAAARAALEQAGLSAGAMCMRYPSEFRLGAFTHPDAAMRNAAVELTIEAAQAGRELGTNELVVWSAFCGYDYSLQVDYTIMWRRMVECFTTVCDACPDTKVSLEFKPTDENTRFFAVPSTGAALQLCADVARPNFGLTLDVGHTLMAGENPAQSVAMVGERGLLFGMQLNDGYGRLGAEDGLMFGSVHPRMALELVWWLQKVDYQGHIYFDTFPGTVDPVREAECNITTFQSMWKQAERLDALGLQQALEHHDTLAALDILGTP